MLFGSQQHILHDQQIVRVVLPVRGGASLAVEGAVKLVSTSIVEILFPPEKFPPGNLQETGEWLLIWERGANVLSAKARLECRLEGSSVRLEITGLFFQTSERRYPRVDAEVYLKYWPARSEANSQPRAIRQKVNISGCGLRFLSRERYAEGDQIIVEISLPGPVLEEVHCVGSVAWIRPVADGGHDVALEIVQIARQDLDKILNFCMVEQFRQLHSKVRVMGPVLSPALERVHAEGGEG